MDTGLKEPVRQDLWVQQMFREVSTKQGDQQRPTRHKEEYNLGNPERVMKIKYPYFTVERDGESQTTLEINFTCLPTRV